MLKDPANPRRRSRAKITALAAALIAVAMPAGSFLGWEIPPELTPHLEEIVGALLAAAIYFTRDAIGRR